MITLAVCVRLGRALAEYRSMRSYVCLRCDPARELVAAYNACPTGEVEGFLDLVKLRTLRDELPEKARRHLDGAEGELELLLAEKIYLAVYPEQATEAPSPALTVNLTEQPANEAAC